MAGADGEDGDGNVHIYRHSLLKPATPTSGVANPTGWVKSPDKGVSTPIPTNWTLKDKWYQSEELTTSGTNLNKRYQLHYHSPESSCSIRIVGRWSCHI